MLEDSPVSTCMAGGKMSLLMDPSFLQHLQEPRAAEGIKYGIIIVISTEIINYTPSLFTLTDSLCLFFLHVSTHRSHMNAPPPLSLRVIQGKTTKLVQWGEKCKNHFVQAHHKSQQTSGKLPVNSVSTC